MRLPLLLLGSFTLGPVACGGGTVADGGWELRYFKPILLQEFCATCHGARDNIPSDVRALIDARYPQDQAVDYAPGDLGGAVAVRVAIPRAE